jgi:5,6-dimethylbenzimidazole synthase
VEEEFSAADREVLYRVIERRRDVRAFRPDSIPSETLYRILGAAHHAPSVGLMQPWNFIVIQDTGTTARIKEILRRENERAAAHYSGPRGMLYRSLIGGGWVSILGADEVRKVLSIPAHVVVVAYLCLGYAQEFFDEPELLRRKWASRVPLDQLVYRERWGQRVTR